MIEIVLISIFIIINGFFAASEIAVVTSRRTRIKQMVDEERKNAKILLSLREEPDRFLATIQIGMTLSGALASAIGGAAAVKEVKPLISTIPVAFIAASSEAISIGLVVVVITFFSLIFGELIPKSVALSNPEGIALHVAPFIRRFSTFATIFVNILTFTSNFLLKPFGRRAFNKRAFVSEEEVKLLIEEGGEQGVFEPEEKELIHSVFEFTDTFVREVMVPAPRMVTIRIRMTEDEVRNIIAEEKFSRYPVIGKDLNDIRGILYAKDFYNLFSTLGQGRHKEDCKAADLCPRNDENQYPPQGDAEKKDTYGCCNRRIWRSLGTCHP